MLLRKALSAGCAALPLLFLIGGHFVQPLSFLEALARFLQLKTQIFLANDFPIGTKSGSMIRSAGWLGLGDKETGGV
jgi:hypothetical protein